MAIAIVLERQEADNCDSPDVWCVMIYKWIDLAAGALISMSDSQQLPWNLMNKVCNFFSHFTGIYENGKLGIP